MPDDKTPEKPETPSKEVAIPGEMLVIADLAASSEAPKVPVIKKTKNA